MTECMPIIQVQDARDAYDRSCCTLIGQYKANGVWANAHARVFVDGALATSTLSVPNKRVKLEGVCCTNLPVNVGLADSGHFYAKQEHVDHTAQNAAQRRDA